jgi:hypothetical protein
MSNINNIVELLAEVDGVGFDDVSVEIMSLVEEPAIGVHWAAFAAQHLFVNKIPGESEDKYLGRCIPQLISEGYDQDQAAAICYAGFESEAGKPYVDNTGMEKFKAFLDENKDLMKKPGGGPAGDGGVDHGAQMAILEEKGINTEYPFGYCFQIAQFMFYALGGYKSEWDLMCIKGMEYKVDGLDFQSTHWFVQSKEDGRIIDLSAEQFDEILDINKYYEDGRRANLGFPYYNVGDTRVEFEETVPSLMTLKLYNKWKEENGELEGIEEFYQACKYEEFRMSLQFSETELPYVTEFDVNVNALPNYIDETGKLKEKEDAFHAAVLAKASEANFGEVLDIEMTTYINLKKDKFETVSDFLRAADAIDVLDQIVESGSQLMVEPSYRYTGRLQANSRTFCRSMIALGKIYTRTEIAAMSAIPFQPGMGPNGTNTYNIFDYKGGVACQHYWEQLRVFRSPGGRNIVISEGPAAGDAGEIASSSNNWWRMSADKSEWRFAEDDDKMIITGPAMKAFQLIPRRDEDGNLFHVYFSDDTIKRLSEKFLKELKLHMTDINHSMQPDEENTLIESWIVEDPEMDKSKALGFNPTKGDWYVSYKINNEETWKQIKAGKLNGFSIAGQFIERMATKN